MTWPLPPQLPWPQFLRLLRHPAPPPGWLEEAAEVRDLQKRPLLLRWIAQHMKAPAELRNRLLPALPWRALAAVAGDASAHPQARSHAVERLRYLWGVMTMGERRSLASLAPPTLWPVVWKVRDMRVLGAFLQNPRLTVQALEALVQPPLTPAQAEALQNSRWKESIPVAHQVLQALDRGLDIPESGLVLGLAVTWILALPPDERQWVSTRLTHPALRRMVRTWAVRGREKEADQDGPLVV
ncbi:MAG: hypothetical protein ABSH53_04840 [Holophaga sp.]